MAILPANVLIPDPSTNWMTTAIPAVFAEDLATSKQYAPVIASDDSSALLNNAKFTLRPVVDARMGRLQLSATLTDLATQRAVLVKEASGNVAAGMLPLLNQLSKAIDNDASPFSTANEQAFLIYAGAIQMPAAQRPAPLQQAIAADPGFGIAYLLLLEALGPQNQAALRETAVQIQLHISQFTPIDQARAKAALDRLGQSLPAQQEQSLSRIVQLSPGDVSAMSSLAGLKVAQMHYEEAAVWVNRALQLEPRSVELLRQRAAIEFAKAKFAEAEKTLEGIGTSNPPVLDMAACRLLEGDLPGANALFVQYAAGNSQPFLPLARANWLAITANREEAIAFLSHSLSPFPQLRSLGLSQLAVWQSAAGDVAGALASANEALRLSGDAGVPREVAETSVLIALSGKDWKKFEQELKQLPPAAQTYIAGYALFLRQRYEEAAKVWANRTAAQRDPTSHIMYAASLLRAGKKDEAIKLGVPLVMSRISQEETCSRSSHFRKCCVQKRI